MIDEDFTPDTGLKVNVNVIPSGALGTGQSVLLLSLAAGQAPDVSFGTPAGTPVELRSGGVYNLNQFPDYNEVIKRFRPGALIPFKYKGGDYALPETQSFQMMFYRKDILQQFNIQVPETWEDVIKILPTLQQYGMNFYYAGGFTPFLYQYGGEYYYADRWYSALDSPKLLRRSRHGPSCMPTTRYPSRPTSITVCEPVKCPSESLTIRPTCSCPPLLPSSRVGGKWYRCPACADRTGVIDRTAAGGSTTAVIYTASRYKKRRRGN